MTLNEWIEKDCPELSQNILISIKQFEGAKFEHLDTVDLHRLVMIMIRQEFDIRNISLFENRRRSK